MEYLFQSTRLGFRKWIASDLPACIRMNQDQEVMKYFPFLMSNKQSEEFINRMNKLLLDKSYCYFAVEELESSRFIGFVGLCDQVFLGFDFVDVGWRLLPEYWNKGYATEGARRCIEYAFDELSLAEIYSVAPEVNISSIHVMKKIGMHLDKKFEHPMLKDYSELVNCELHIIKKDQL